MLFFCSNHIASTTVSFPRLRNMVAFQLLREIFSWLPFASSHYFSWHFDGEIELVSFWTSLLCFLWCRFLAPRHWKFLSGCSFSDGGSWNWQGIKGKVCRSKGCIEDTLNFPATDGQRNFSASDFALRCQIFEQHLMCDTKSRTLSW